MDRNPDVESGNYLYKLSIKNAITCCVKYFILLVFIALIAAALWGNFPEYISGWLNIITIIVLNIAFIKEINRDSLFIKSICKKISFKGILIAIGGAILFYFLLDRFVEPIFAGLFPQSRKMCYESAIELIKVPLCAFIRVCILAPIFEELFIRGYILGGLKNEYGDIIALLVSSILFGILHFNIYQAISACICGFVLGFIYIKTESIYCSMICHSIYNAISFFRMIKL